MCGRFFADDALFVTLTDFGIELKGKFKGSTNITPSEEIAVIHKINDRLVADPMTWGYSPGWDKGPKFIVNLKSETILEKKFAQLSLKTKRCIIPASGFFEWKEESPKHKVPYAFQLEDKNPFGIAAIYFEKNTEKLECVLFTTSANSVVSNVHDRMPVIVEPEKWEEWISGENISEILNNYAHPFLEKPMISFKVSEAFNKAGFKGELIN